METESVVETARACFEAYVSKDRAAIERLIAADFHFTSPLDNRLDRAAYFQRCWPNSARIADFDFIHLMPVGNQVFVTYEGRGTDGGRFRNTEILTVNQGQVAQVEVYFGWPIPHKASAGAFLKEGK